MPITCQTTVQSASLSVLCLNLCKWCKSKRGLVGLKAVLGLFSKILHSTDRWVGASATQAGYSTLKIRSNCIF